MRDKGWFAENFSKMENFWNTVLYNREHPEMKKEKVKRRITGKKEKVQNECMIVSDDDDD